MNSKQLYLRLLTYVKPYWRTFAVAIVAMVVLALSEPALPALLKPMLDGSFVEKDPAVIGLVPLLMIGLFLLRGIADYVSAVALEWVANKVVMDLRQAMFQRLVTLPTLFFDQHASGNLISRLTYDVNQVTAAATQALIVLVKDSLTVAGLLAWMLYLNWKLTLFFLVAGPPAALVIRRVGVRLRTLSRSLQKSMGDLTNVVEEAVSGHKVVKVFGGQDYEQRRFFQVSNWVRRYAVKSKMASAASVPIVQLIAATAMAGIFYIATSEQNLSEVTVGGFVSFFVAMGMLFGPIKRLTSLNDKLQKGLAAAESVFELLDEQPEHDPGSGTMERAVGRIEFRDVSFAYPTSGKRVLQNITLSVEPGETVALVGRSGAGKTTLASLIPRFYDSYTGQILLDGTDIRELELANLRKHISYVGQEVVLFNDTVEANIAYGTLDHTDEHSIRRAATAAHAMEYIEQLPEGLHTVVGQRGMRLSGGQRQRLTIARALLKAAPVLILDEATSSLDSESERKVQDALATLRRGRTTLVIAHRLSTIENADRIVVLQDGAIVEMGKHTELLATGGLYADLYRSHSQ
jgi:subfamily B ATP-binding cassette protein MsbA